MLIIIIILTAICLAITIVLSAISRSDNANRSNQVAIYGEQLSIKSTYIHNCTYCNDIYTYLSASTIEIIFIFSWSHFTDNKTSGEPPKEPSSISSNNHSDCVNRIKKVQFSNENITIENNHNDFAASGQLHHKHCNNIELSSNNSDSSNSEISMSNDTSTERPSFLVSFLRWHLKSWIL